jgi:tripartite-type tricarboxylate transporter receptor subunit TctC
MVVKTAALIGVWVLGAAAGAQAQDYPEKPIRLIVPYAAGGGVDLLGRSIITRLSERLGQPMVYDNRGGAGATIGTGLAARATPDGYTLLFSLNALTIAASIYPDLTYDPLKDLAPVTQFLASSSVLVVNPGLNVRSVKEFIALAKAKPGELNYASQGVGTNAHMAMELFKRATGSNIVHIPYKGGGPASTALFAGEVKVMFLASSFGAPIIKAGKVVPLAVSTSRRLKILPDIPTLDEAGVPGAERNEYSGWWGLLAPAGTPGPIIRRIQRDAAATVATGEITELLESRGLQPVGSTPEAFAAMLREDLARWKKVAKEANIRAR